MPSPTTERSVVEVPDAAIEALARRFWKVRILGSGLPFWHELTPAERQVKLDGARDFIEANLVGSLEGAVKEHLSKELSVRLNARESSALVQAETALPDGSLRWVAAGRAEAYRYLLDHLPALLDLEAEQS
jgi:hypothetical protein